MTRNYNVCPIYPSSTLTRERGGAPPRRLTHALGEVAAGAAGGEVLLPPTKNFRATDAMRHKTARAYWYATHIISRKAIPVAPRS